jgi:hypothetical protein
MMIHRGVSVSVVGTEVGVWGQNVSTMVDAAALPDSGVGAWLLRARRWLGRAIGRVCPYAADTWLNASVLQRDGLGADRRKSHVQGGDDGSVGISGLTGECGHGMFTVQIL